MAKNDFLFPKAGVPPLSQWAGGQLAGDEHKTGASALYKPTPPTFYRRVAGSEPARSKGLHTNFLSKRPEAYCACQELRASNHQAQQQIPIRGSQGLKSQFCFLFYPKGFWESLSFSVGEGTNYLSGQIGSSHSD